MHRFIPACLLLTLGCAPEPDPGAAADAFAFDADLPDRDRPPGDTGPRDVGLDGAPIDMPRDASPDALPDASPDARPPAVERCDGLDQDGDGQVDEGSPPAACAVGVGQCRREGETRCVEGAAVCQVLPGAPQVERSGDQLDQDCDGVVDEAVVDDPAAGLASVAVGSAVCLHYLDGRVQCYGRGPTLDRLPGRYRQIAADFGLCGVTLDGGVRCWQFTDGAPMIEAPGDFTQVAVGGNLGCPVDRAGAHHCSGSWFGAPGGFIWPFDQPVARIAVHTKPWAILQNGDLSETGPQAVPIPGPFIDLSARHRGICAVRDNGSLYCENARAVPANLPPAVAVRLTSDYTCIQTRGGDLRCWGLLERAGIPEAIPGPFVQFDATAQALCGIRVGGELVCFGGVERGGTHCALDPLDCGPNGRCQVALGARDQRSCLCEPGFAGARCDECAPGFGQPPDCVVDCEPGARRCRGQHQLEVCVADGSRWEVERTCCGCNDLVEGFGCFDPFCVPDQLFCEREAPFETSSTCGPLGCETVRSVACECGCDDGTGQCLPPEEGCF